MRTMNKCALKIITDWTPGKGVDCPMMCGTHLTKEEVIEHWEKYSRVLCDKCELKQGRMEKRP